MSDSRDPIIRYLFLLYNASAAGFLRDIVRVGLHVRCVGSMRNNLNPGLHIQFIRYVRDVVTADLHIRGIIENRHEVQRRFCGLSICCAKSKS